MSCDAGRGGVECAGHAAEAAATAPAASASGCPDHRRSKSASDRNFEFSRAETSKFSQKDPKKITENPSKIHGGEESPSQSHSSDYTTNQRASLENDIGQLQMRLQQERSVRIMLERALGRTSSSLSPGHRHFSSQIKELISDIETLEAEVTNQEQHVLSLYRNIFDQCTSKASSAQCSQAPSPSHAKTETKKHPHVISNAFCSSRKFSLQSFHVLASIREPGKRDLLLQSKSRHGSQLCGCTTHHAGSNTPKKAHKRLSTTGRSFLANTTKNYLHYCPSKLSEELVRRMASIYYWACGEGTAKQEKRSHVLSRSSTNPILPKHGFAENQEPSHKAFVEIPSFSTNKCHFSSESLAICNYRVLIEQLERVDISKLESKAKLAFWINLYNSLIMHAYLAYGIPHSNLKRMSMFRKVAYNVGGHVISASSIEHSILCCHTPRTGSWFESILWTAMRKKSGEDKEVQSSGFGLEVSEPLVHFTLCTGASSDPMLRVYNAKHIEEELETAKKHFLQANVVVKKSKKVFLPKLLDRYAKEASLTLDDLLPWVANNVDEKLRESMQKCLDANSKKKASQIVEWLPYNTRFHYFFERELTEKP